jgi:type II secretory pathway component PulF
VILVLFGLLNVVFPPFAMFFSNLGRRLARRGND